MNRIAMRDSLGSAASCSTLTKGGPRQPPDRQLRYYSEAPSLASAPCEEKPPRHYIVGNRKVSGACVFLRATLSTQQTPPTAGWRFDARYSHWPPGKWRAVNRIRRSCCRF